MEDTQRDARVADEPTGERQPDESRDEQTSAVPAGPLLANPRRIRRA